MRFRTEIESTPVPFSLNGSERILTIGSCFAEHIGRRLEAGWWTVCVNPCGVQYNPLSIYTLFDAAITGPDASGSPLPPLLPDDTFFSHADLHRNWLLPSRFTSTDAAKCRDASMHALSELAENALSADVLMVTFGTAWYYTHRPSALSPYSEVVGNCHKVPSAEFSRDLLDIDATCSLWVSLLDRLCHLNPRLKVIFTVSPVRHVKDGLHGNTISKATLHLLVGRIMAARPKCTDYFPAYEILNDDLRDYRFYAADMVHPSDVAVDYVWQCFRRRYFTPEAETMTSDGEKLTRRINHRPLTDDAAALDRFNSETERLKSEFLTRYPRP